MYSSKFWFQSKHFSLRFFVWMIPTYFCIYIYICIIFVSFLAPKNSEETSDIYPGRLLGSLFNLRPCQGTVFKQPIQCAATNSATPSRSPCQTTHAMVDGAGVNGRRQKIKKKNPFGTAGEINRYQTIYMYMYRYINVNICIYNEYVYIYIDLKIPFKNPNEFRWNRNFVGFQCLPKNQDSIDVFLLGSSGILCDIYCKQVYIYIYTNIPRTQMIQILQDLPIKWFRSTPRKRGRSLGSRYTKPSILQSGVSFEPPQTKTPEPLGCLVGSY